MITLAPEYHKKSKDYCEIELKKKYIKIVVVVDGCGNTFKLPINKILIALGGEDETGTN